MPITTYTPAAADALFDAYAGRAFDDPRVYGSHNNRKVTSIFFLKPVQDEILKLIAVCTTGGGALKVINKTGGSLAAGPVRVIGWNTTAARFEVGLADASFNTPADGFLLSALANDTNGLIYFGGALSGIDTSGGAVGDAMYLSASGTLTRTAPTGADEVQQILGRIKTVSASGTVDAYIGPIVKVGTSFLQSESVTAAKLAALNALTDADVGLTDEVPVYSAAAAANRNLSIERILGYAMPGLCDGRLTLETGVPVSTSDQTSKTTVYFTPYNGNRVALYDGTRWKLYTFTERSLALGTLTSGKNYDVFLYDNSGTLTLELSAAWTSDTARSDALTTQDGVYVKSGATTRKYLGTIRTTSTTTTEDSKSKRFVWNAYNRITRNMFATDGTNSWTGTGSAWRGANNATTARIEFVRGLNEDNVRANVQVTANSSTTAEAGVGIGLDSTTVNSANMFGGFIVGGQFDQVCAHYNGAPGLGYHYLQWLEYYGGAGTITWYSDNGSSFWQSGIMGEVTS